ncbi:molybdopterin-guanine dinucleotide biosynthesis protein A [Alcanivorax hongdengensis A-11-3]|uniref:Molybdopterin-guanine dinucleotide biosynthesis protein A n=1 Tax=Alcanivorax hongdengensis A-11-3 TaxID=1177179 RepID=L0WGX5_9GAMM|nr:NTP transferase domain-containing protein [Alcanivorax hongdengensis]EKF75085.1 molybdopterin-guanine dinucleotide biosynthesis protein A [Alcanivorax hongdengensis A-11-3]
MQDYTLIVLAGGRGTRMGGADKGLVTVGDHPLVLTLITALTPPPVRVIISANRNQPSYAQWADQVVSDLRDDFQGPLAGLEAALAIAHGPCVCLPCDLLAPPASLIASLLAPLRPGQPCVARDPQRLQPLCLSCCASDDYRQTLGHYLDNGGRSARGWLASYPHQTVTLDQPLDNLNHLPQP